MTRAGPPAFDVSSPSPARMYADLSATVDAVRLAWSPGSPPPSIAEVVLAEAG
jgi:hypothetical protein